MDQREFEGILHSEFHDTNRSRTDLEAYFSTTVDRYTGSQFEQLCDHAEPYRITERDILAVTTLSVDIPSRVTLWLLSDEGTRTVSELLRLVPPEVEMWHAEAVPLLGRGGPMWRLWDVLAEAHWPTANPANDMGRTKISKLLATKRPRLSPVLDSVITGKVLPGMSNYWEAFRSALSDPALRKRLSSATASPVVPVNVTLLRRIDAVLWFRHHRDS